jgi:hypothetical protein
MLQALANGKSTASSLDSRFGDMHMINKELAPVIKERAHLEARPSAPLQVSAARQIDIGAATIAFSVFADSSLEHFRGGFHNRAMFIAPSVSAMTLAAAAASARRPYAVGHGRQMIFTGAMLTGLAGFGFHLYNVSRRVGGWNWSNAFYGAPVGAPMAINLAGILGLVAAHIGQVPVNQAPRLLGLPAGKTLSIGVAGGIVGTTAEVALLHFRGAFQNRYMYLPVTVPPLAALALAGAAVSESPVTVRAARLLLCATAFLGFIGVGFHARGVARNMGGWRNWTQNLQSGPPLPAPPSFTGLAIAGLAALKLLSMRGRT